MGLAENDEDDDDDDDEDENKLVVSGLEHKPLITGLSGSGGGGVGRTLDEEDDDEDEESEQPCDLRLSSHFNINLVSMALQQAAVAATGDRSKNGRSHGGRHDEQRQFSS